MCGRIHSLCLFCRVHKQTQPFPWNWRQYVPQSQQDTHTHGHLIIIWGNIPFGGIFAVWSCNISKGSDIGNDAKAAKIIKRTSLLKTQKCLMLDTTVIMVDLWCLLKTIVPYRRKPLFLWTSTYPAKPVISVLTIPPSRSPCYKCLFHISIFNFKF